MSAAGLLACRTYVPGDEVIPVAGAFVGFEGEVDEVDTTSNDGKPYRVRFDVEGEPIAWYGAEDLTPAPKRELAYSWKRTPDGGAR